MAFNIGLAQSEHPADGDVLGLARAFAREARAADVSLLVFPESLMTPYEKTREDFLASAEPADGPFARGMAAIAEEYGLWIVHTLNERNDDPDGLPFNTAVVVDDAGRQQGTYRKTHLFDTDFVQESDRMARGDALFEPVRTPFCTLGLAICYDLRFPEVARAAAVAGCDVMAFPAAWVEGPGKLRQWRTLIAARAIENQMFVAGLSRTGEGYVGGSLVVDPRGEMLAEADKQPGLVVGRIDLDVAMEARASMPVMRHRRKELYTFDR